MATTTNLGLTLPTVGADDDTWGTENNDVHVGVDAVFKADGTGTSVGLKVGSGKTLNAIDGTVNVSDSTFSIKDNSDPTKIAQFQCSGITTSTTRTFTLPDASGTLLYSGGALGTPASGDLANCTGYPGVVAQVRGDFSTLPTLTGTGSDPTVGYAARVARYVKDDKKVTDTVRIALNSYSGGSGNLTITNGLSHTPKNTSGLNPAPNISYIVDYVVSASAFMVALRGVANSTTLSMNKFNFTSPATSPGTVSGLSSTFEIEYSCTYEID